MKTIVEMLEISAQKYANNNYLLEKRTDRYEATTFKETRDQALKVAAGLMALGVVKEDRIALLSESRTDWVICELGILHAGAISVPLSIILKEGADLKFRLEHSESKWIFVSALQLGKISAIRSQLGNIEKIVLIDPKESYAPDEIWLGDLMKKGEEFLSGSYERLVETMKSIGSEDIANICYTSGTTADPKGIMLSHGNYIANIKQALTLFDVPEWWTTLLILPWDHSFAHTVGIYIMMYTGASLAAVQSGKSYLDSLRHIGENIKEIRPVFLFSAPALSKNLRKAIEKGIQDKGAFAEKLFSHALKIAYSYNGIGWDRGRGIKIFLKPLYKLYDIILFSKIRKNFGGRLKFFVGGAALLDIELQKFFYAIGIPIFQGYGLTEASPVISSNAERRHKLGSSGFLVKNMDLRICDEEGNELLLGEKGEIVIRGENVMKGYWKNESATKDSIRDGWLYTGDLGYMDSDGFLYVIGRFKSLLISDDGEKYSPEGIEETITDRSSFIDQFMLYNNQCRYTTALLVPNKDAIVRWVKGNGIDLSEPKGLEVVLDKLGSEVDQYKQGGMHDDLFPSRWLPSAVGIIDEPFTMDNRQVSSAGKMVRGKIVERHQSTLDYLYTSEAKNIVNPMNIEAMKRLMGIN